MLTILIPTIQSRLDYFTRIMDCLNKQKSIATSIIALSDNGEASIGAKRNELLSQAPNDGWITWVDDDDLVSPDYCESIINALQSNPDIVTFDMQRTDNGVFHSIEKFSLDRTIDWTLPPTHICPIRASIAKSIQFPEINQGEDSKWLASIYPLLKTEVRIAKTLYYYEYRTDKSQEIRNT